MNREEAARLAAAFQKFGEGIARVVEKMAKAIQKVVDWLVPLRAAEGIAQLEMDLKLRSEVGLRTDLLALFDP